MKRLSTHALFLLILLTFATCHLQAQSAWNSMGPGSTTYTFNSIQFLDANRGFTVGDNNMAYTTTDGGQNWTQRQVESNFMDFEDVFFTNPSNGWIIEQGLGGAVYHSTDGGATWSPASVSAGTLLSQVFFTDDNHGWITGVNGSIVGTTNGGTTWNDVSLGFGQTFDINAAFFTDATHGVVGCELGTLYYTTNGGTSWTQAQNSAISSALIMDIDFADANFGVTGSTDGVLRKTTNGGTSWTSMNSPTTDGIQALEFVSSTLGWIVDDAEYVHRTSDGGATWISEYVPFQKNSMYFVNANEGWMAGWDGFIYHTSTGGIVGSAEPIAPSGTVLIHPNPATDRIHLSFDQSLRTPAIWTLYSADGSIIHTATVPVSISGQSMEIQLPSVAAGIYAYQVQQGGHSTCGRLAIR